MKIDLHLARVKSNTNGTFGVLSWHGQPFAVSLEDPWKYNKSYVSCIPSGTYTCKRVDSPSFGDTFEVTDVRGGRTHILFHKGNTQKDTQGCILVAESFGELEGVPGVLSSGDGYKEFMNLTEGMDTFSLSIRDFW